MKEIWKAVWSIFVCLLFLRSKKSLYQPNSKTQPLTHSKSSSLSSILYAHCPTDVLHIVIWVYCMVWNITPICKGDTNIRQNSRLLLILPIFIPKIYCRLPDTDTEVSNPVLLLQAGTWSYRCYECWATYTTNMVSAQLSFAKKWQIPYRPLFIAQISEGFDFATSKGGI